MASSSNGSWPDLGPDDALRPLEHDVLRHLFELSPAYAVFLGLHEYDGRLPDLSPGATDRWARDADALLVRLRDPSMATLAPGRQYDRMLLELLLESPLFDLRESHDYERNPMAYVGLVSLTAYMVRAYAPIRQRVTAMRRLLEAVPWMLETGRRRLHERLPKPFVQLAISMASGLHAHLEEAEQFAASGGPELRAAFAQARAPAEKAVQEFLERLSGEYTAHAISEFALGAERFQKLLWVREGIRTPIAEVLAAGRADLERNQRRLAEIARRRHPGQSEAAAVASTFESLFVRHPTAEQLLPRAREFVEETKRFMLDRQLVSLPEPAMCRVDETPVYGRSLSTASMNPPGPLEAAGDEGIYYITPVDAAWPKEKQEEWLRSFNDVMLRNVTVHEVYPGHYLQFLHLRRGADSLARKVYLSASFSEGWAHYTEQLAIEAGLGAGSDDAEVAQIHDALLRDCRLISSIGLHTQGWTVAQSTELFMREAHFEQLPSEREAIRGTFNPEYFCYTLGKLAILDARAKFLKSRFSGSLKEFHDTLLSFGSPPVGLLETLLAA